LKTAIIFVAILFIPALTFSATIHVPDHYPTIQQAIDAAMDGDTVLVAPGTYVENIQFLGKAIIVRGEQGAYLTFIDGGQPKDPDHGSVVHFNQNEGWDSVLEGFTLMNGTGTGNIANRNGGGILCGHFTSPTIRNNVIMECFADAGGGMMCDPDSGPLVTGCTFLDNTATYDGGGICGYICYADIIGNTISGNTAKDGAGVYLVSVHSFKFNDIRGNTASNEGGGAYMSMDLIDSNRITDNKALSGGGIYCLGDGSVMNNTILRNEAIRGGGICFEGSEMEAANNIVAENQAEEGGGIYFSWYYTTICSKLANNVFTRNWALKGGGIHCSFGQENRPLEVTNSVFWENDRHEMYLGWSFGSGAMNISYSDVEGGLDAVHLEGNFTLNWGPGMIDADPLFADPDHDDFHLTFNSPCQDSGDDTAVLDPYDFEGDPRIAYGFVDMGADEFYTHLYCMGDFTPGGSIEGKLVGLPGTSPVGLFFGSGVLDPPVPTMWGNFYLQAPWLMFPLVPIPSNGVLVLPAMIPATPPAPYDLPMQALIGLDPDSLSNLFVLEVR
jgi:hypothetical protein